MTSGFDAVPCGKDDSHESNAGAASDEQSAGMLAGGATTRGTEGSKLPSFAVYVSALAVKLSSPGYVACAVTGELAGGTAGETLHVATPPVIGTVSVGRPSHWRGSAPLMAKATEPVGVVPLEGPPVTFALKMVDEEVVATTKSLVLEPASVVDPAEAPGAPSNTTAPLARTKPATSAHTPRGKIWRCLRWPCRVHFLEDMVVTPWGRVERQWSVDTVDVSVCCASVGIVALCGTAVSLVRPAVTTRQPFGHAHGRTFTFVPVPSHVGRGLRWPATGRGSPGRGCPSRARPRYQLLGRATRGRRRTTVRALQRIRRPERSGRCDGLWISAPPVGARRATRH